jgi:hypothetical protein
MTTARDTSTLIGGPSIAPAATAHPPLEDAPGSYVRES